MSLNLELLLPLSVGAQLILATTAEQGDGAALAARLIESQPTVMQATPATWRMLLAAGWTAGLGLRVLCGGESLDPGLAERLHATGCELWNLYGPTETTVWSTVARVLPGQKKITVGRPIANTRLWIADDALRS